jgi:hypothetical protein
VPWPSRSRRALAGSMRLGKISRSRGRNSGMSLEAASPRVRGGVESAAMVAADST